MSDINNNTRNSTKSWHISRLIACDTLLLFMVAFVLLLCFPSGTVTLSPQGIVIQLCLMLLSMFTCRLLGGIYRHVWRYGGTTLYIRLIITDAVAAVLYYIMNVTLPIERISFLRALAVTLLNLTLTLSLRFVYQYLNEYSSRDSAVANFLRNVTRMVTGMEIEPQGSSSARDGEVPAHKINVAVVGAGRVGVMLAEELLNNKHTSYQPRCFIDIDREKIGRYINGIRVLSEQEATKEMLATLGIQEIVFALPSMSVERKRELYEQYKQTGCKIKVYDYPITRAVENSKRHLREFDIEELLFRQVHQFTDERTGAYYRDKVILISGGGGSIGSELCRQISQMKPKQLVILDLYENGAYDIQQELHIAYGDKLNLAVEIMSVCDRPQLERIFARYRPDVVLHAAAHKHVPLMEHNCCEAVKNNVFGTLSIVEASEKYGVKKFIMVSTDKAVNPTNVMGATKRMCEMIVQNRAGSQTSFSATRFGNVLGSNGSVIPLFKRQIMNGGPVTLTDKRISRYFMTIPEASQLVLISGAMAKNGELYVLDMGKPIKILELAENMIRLSGYEPYKDIAIVETGLRPGEKLYEELLIKTEELDKTDNNLIFVERDRPKGDEKIRQKLDILRAAVFTEDDAEVKEALKRVVSTYHEPEEVNAEAENAQEMDKVVETKAAVAG